jgi:hypothetical protein
VLPGAADEQPASASAPAASVAIRPRVLRGREGRDCNAYSFVNVRQGIRVN